MSKTPSAQQIWFYGQKLTKQTTKRSNLYVFLCNSGRSSPLAYSNDFCSDDDEDDDEEEKEDVSDELIWNIKPQKLGFLQDGKLRNGRESALLLRGAPISTSLWTRGIVRDVFLLPHWSKLVWTTLGVRNQTGCWWGVVCNEKFYGPWLRERRCDLRWNWVESCCVVGALRQETKSLGLLRFGAKNKIMMFSHDKSTD